MKHVTVSLVRRAAERHPMHQFLVDTEGYEATRLVGSTVTEGVHTALFHVAGWPPEPYEEALAELETVREHALSRQSDRTFSVYVREELRDRDREITDAFGRSGMITLLPVVYRDDGAVRLRLVGPGTTLQAALDEVPAGTTIDVRTVGDYDARRIGGERDLTHRQAEAVRAAVECGYYEEPRAASVAEVAAELDCAPGTAAEHLRRAERTVMRAYV